MLEVQLIFDPAVNQSSKPSRDQISNSNSKGNSRSSSSNSTFDKSLRSNSIFRLLIVTWNRIVIRDRRFDPGNDGHF